MSESFSDLDNISVKDSQNDTLGDIQILEEAQIERLQEENAELIREISSLRAQFEQAITMSSQVNLLHQDNSKLTAQLMDAETEKKELEQRLEISIKAQNELNKKLNEEKASNSNQRNSDISKTNKSVEKLKKVWQEQTESMNQEMQSIIQEKEASEIDRKLMYTKIESILHSASYYFGHEFQGEDDLVSFLEKRPEKSIPQKKEVKEVPKIASIPQQVASDERKLIKKLKKKKMELQGAVSHIQELEEQIDDLQELNSKEKVQHQKEISLLESKYRQNIEEKNQIESSLQKKVAILESRIISMKQENDNLKTEKQAQPFIIHPSPVIDQIIQSKPNRSEIKEYEALNDQLNNKVTDLFRQLDSVQKKKNEIANQLSIKEDTCNKLIISLEKEKGEHNSLKSIHNETINELETLRKAFYSLKSSKQKNSEIIQKKEMNSQKAALIQLEKKVEALKKHTYEIQMEKEKSDTYAQETHTLYENSESENRQLKDKIDHLNAEIIELNKKFDEKPTLTEEDLIPKASWYYSEFDQSLTSALEKVLSNDSLHPSSRLQSVLKTIYRHYSRIIDSRNQDYQALLQEHKSLQDFMKEFLIEISISLSGKSMSFEEFVQSGWKSIITQISTMTNSLIDYRRKYDYLQATHEQFKSHFGSISENNGDFSSQIAQASRHMKTLETKIQEMTKKNKVLKGAIKTIESDFSKTNETLQISTNEFNNTSRALQNEIKTLKDTNNSLKLNNRTLQEQLDETASRLSSLEEDSKRAQSDYQKNQDTERNMFQQRYKDDVNKIINELNSAQTLISSYEEQVTKQSKAICSLKANLDEKEKELDEARIESDTMQKVMLERFEIEKQNLSETYENAILDLKNQCNSHRQDLSKLSSQLVSSDNRIKELKSNILQLKRDNSKLEKEISTLVEQNDRDRKLCEAEIRGATIQAESAYSMKLNEIKSKWESEKRRLLSFTADEFKLFFNPQETMDERSFKSLISRAKEEISRLSKMDAAIRRMVGAAPRQPTEDAVAQVLVGK